MITAAAKQALIDSIIRRHLDISLPVIRVIIRRINPEHGVAFWHFTKYAEDAGRSERTVLRAVQRAVEYDILGRAYRVGPPVLWARDLMDLDPEEAVRRADALADGYREGFAGRAAAIRAASIRRGADASPQMASPSIGKPPQGAQAAPLSGEVPSSLSGEVPSSLSGEVPSSLSGEVPSSLSGEVPSSLSGEAQPDLFATQLLTPEMAPVSTPEMASPYIVNLKPVNPQIVNTKPAAPAAARAAAAPPPSGKALDLAKEIGEAVGLPGATYQWPEHWRIEAPRIVHRWLNDLGWQAWEDRHPGIILKCVKFKMKEIREKEGKHPSRVKFFEPVLEEYFKYLVENGASPIARPYQARQA
jgi:hypothetical protein